MCAVVATCRRCGTVHREHEWRKLKLCGVMKVEQDGATSYFVAYQSIEALVDMGDKIKIGVYKLVETKTAVGVVRVAPQ